MANTVWANSHKQKKIMAAVKIEKMPDGFAVKFAFERLEEFKAHVDRHRWIAQDKAWFVPASAEAQLYAWAPLVSNVFGRETPGAEEKIAAYREKAAVAKKAVDELQAATDRAMAAKKARQEVLAAKRQRLGALALHAKNDENNQAFKQFGSIFCDDFVVGSLRTVQDEHSKGEKFDNAKKRIIAAYKKLLDAGFTTPGLTAVAINPTWTCALETAEFEPEDWVKLEAVESAAKVIPIREDDEIDHYKVTADIETGEWIGEPVFVGKVLESVWNKKTDTALVHYDRYEHFSDDVYWYDCLSDVDHGDGDGEVNGETGIVRGGSETRAIEVVWTVTEVEAEEDDEKEDVYVPTCRAISEAHSLQSVVNIINDDGPIGPDMTPAQLAGQYAHEAADEAGYGCGEAEIEVWLEFLSDAGAVFDVCDAIAHAAAMEAARK